jgi:predicted O-linked N-acetylglucosamine transferase (SPINDLY family)
VAASTPEQLLENALAAQRRGAIADAKRLYASVLGIDPGHAAALGNLAIIAAQEGDLAGAERLLRQGIARRGDDALSFNNLGRVLLRQGKLAQAIAAHRRALELRPAYAEAHLALGAALKQQGALSEALACYRKAIATRPGYAEAHNNVGVVLQSQGRLEEAAAAYGEAIALQPAYLEARFNLATVLHEQRRFEPAAAVYRQVIEMVPGLAAAHNNLGSVLQDQGRFGEAIDAFEQAIRLAPDYAEAHFNHGAALQRQGQAEPALAAYGRAMALRPDYADAINNAGIVLQDLGRAGEAIDLYRRLIERVPDHADAYNNIGTAWLALGRPDEARSAFQAALARRPDFAQAAYNLGNAWRELGDLAAAIAAYQDALRLRPDDVDAFGQLVHHREQACAWDNLQADQDRLIGMVRHGARIPPFYLLSTKATAADQLLCARQWITPMLPPRQAVFGHQNGLDRDHRAAPARIRLGYLSGDFHQHATAHLMAELFECHDRERFEVFAYSYGPDDGSPMRSRLGRAFDRLIDIRALPHREAARRIYADHVDILIDLKGYTHHARPAISAHRPAPVQVSYLGFPATMGADFIDYVIVDPLVVPASRQAFFSERLVHLPGSYQVNDRRRETAGAPTSRRDFGLPDDALVFCSFNNSYKISPEFFDIWMDLLRSVPGSVLWLLETNALAKVNLRNEAVKRGVGSGRLIFAPLVPSAEHLARLRHADLFLDTLPCNAHTTASDALWAGLPVVTATGDTFAGRVAASLLCAAGLPELVTGSPEEYARKALALAGDRPQLQELREKLQSNRSTSPLFDLPRSTRHIETAYVRMWETWCAGRPPAGFSVDPLIEV